MSGPRHVARFRRRANDWSVLGVKRTLRAHGRGAEVKRLTHLCTSTINFAVLHNGGTFP